MNFLILIDTLDFGGAERQVVLDANALLRKGHDVNVAFFRSGPLEPELDHRAVREHVQEAAVLGRVKALRRLFLRLQPDLVMAHMFRAEITAGFAAMAARAPVIFNEHGLGLWRSAHHKWALRLASMFAREVWCASDVCSSLRKDRDGLKAEKVHTVYNSFNLKRQGLSNDKLKAEILSGLGRPPGTPIIGFVGRFDPVKRLKLLIDAATHETLRKAVFVLVGDGLDGTVLKKLVSEKGLDGWFYFSGFVPKPGEYFDVFDIFVLPSKRESLSVALLEAGSVGLPAVAFDVGGNAEIIQNEATGVVVSDNNIEAFHDALGRLVQSEKLRRSMGDAAKNRVKDMFSEQRRMEEILAAAKRYAPQRNVS